MQLQEGPKYEDSCVGLRSEGEACFPMEPTAAMIFLQTIWHPEI